MFGWFRRAPELREYGAQPAHHHFRRTVKINNQAMRPPKDFEPTVAERRAPLFGAEIAESQSLKATRKALKDERAAGTGSIKGRRS